MKEKILDIAKKLYHNHLTPETATNLILNLFTVSKQSEQLFCDACGKPKENGLDHCRCYEGEEWITKANVSVSDLYKMITTDFEFDFFGDKVKVITDYEKGDKDKKQVQLVKLSEPKKSFGVHDKLDIVEYLKNHYH